MKIKLYQVDAFTDKVFGGNPAAICIIDNWLAEDLMQKIAEENNLAETAFVVNKNDCFEIRWFTPTVEVDLCGHATLASAHVIFNYCQYNKDTIVFQSPRSGELFVKKEEELLTLNFPTDDFKKIELLPEFIAGFDKTPLEGYKGKTDYMFVFSDESEIKDIKVDLDSISKLEGRGVIITAKGSNSDFVSRFFAPQSGIDEDPVTGSAHTTLTPYWSSVLGKKEMTAIQLSKRRGYLNCKHLGERVEISGKAVTYLTGEIDI